MPLDFPTSPSVNQVYTYNATSWTWDGISWVRRDGTVGDKGGVKYTFSTTITDSDPGNGTFRYNSATISSVAFIYIDNIDALGVTQTSWYDTWDDSSNSIEGQLIVAGNSELNTNIFNITGAVIVASGYYKIPVSYVSGSLPGDGSSYLFQFYSSGNLGPTGPTGPSNPLIDAMLYR